MTAHAALELLDEILEIVALTDDQTAAVVTAMEALDGSVRPGYAQALADMRARIDAAAKYAYESGGSHEILATDAVLRMIDELEFDSPAWCADCKARHGRAGTFPARYPGSCGWCDGPIEPGDPIAPEPDCDGGWICADCHEEATG